MSDTTSKEWNKAMLRAKLSGNQIKVMLAYLDFGGWKPNAEVYLAQVTKTEYGLSDSTVDRAHKELVALGWLIPTGHKTRYGINKYVCAIPPVQNDAARSVKMNLEVVQNEPRAGSKRTTEVIEEVTKEVTKESNELSSVADAPSLNDSLITNKKNDEAAAPLDSLPYSPIEEAHLILQETEVSPEVQNEPPLTDEDRARAAVLKENPDLGEDAIQTAVKKVLNRAGWMSNIHPIQSRATYAVYDAVNGELDWS